jgi:hypothetical protein
LAGLENKMGKKKLTGLENKMGLKK